ncbi:MAG TPA: IS30 family transposase [Microbacteriaceae bacterium]|nr:IS30 family transposase [Microbacteriaceae bacterium]
MAYSKGVRARALELLQIGESSRDVSRLLGVSRHSVQRWAKMVGMRFKQHDYHGGIIGTEFGASSTKYGPTSAGLPANGKIGLSERVTIEVRHRDGWSARKIAATLGMATSTITRELSLGAQFSGGDTYLAAAAQQRSLLERARPKTRKLHANVQLRAEVVARLKNRHSPEQIAHRLKIDFPATTLMHISHETIYRELYSRDVGSLFNEFDTRKSLRTGRKKRRKRFRTACRLSRKPWVKETPIVTRPIEVEDRQTVGHWEGDLVIGRGSRSALISLIERKTRFNLLARLPIEHTSLTVIMELEKMLRSLPEGLKLSLTWDQGVEMARVKTFTQAVNCPVYFCDPHSPWQRGSNENLNGLIRDFYPKGTDFSMVTDAEIQDTQLLLNDRPKRVLGWATPAEAIGFSL